MNADSLDEQGNTLRAQGRAAEAERYYRQALVLDPYRAETHNNLGAALLDQGRLAQAMSCFQDALRLHPGFVAALNNLGSVLMDLGRLGEATQCFEQALRLDPVDANAHNNLGTALRDMGRLQEAEMAFLRAAALTSDPGSERYIRAAARYNLSLLRLLQGRYLEAWPGFDARFEIFGASRRHADKPLWNGGHLVGKTILVHTEQGLGDTIQFARFLPMVRASGAEVVLECQPVLKDLLATSAGTNTVVAAGAALPPCDVQVPLLSVPGIVGTTVETIPAQVPYLLADPARVAHWTRELGPAQGLKVGIVWQGNPAYSGDRQRSAPLVAFEPLARIPFVRLLSLQVGAGAEQIQAAPFSVVDLGRRFDRSSFADITALMVNLDLVVTVETAAAHLAGALGVPVWTVLHFHADWRWLLERLDSPWYPTMRLFRQSRPGDWNEVFERVLKGLTA